MDKKTIDNIVWWIPIKKYRDLFRELLINISEIKELSKNSINTQNKIIDINKNINEINKKIVPVKIDINEKRNLAKEAIRRSIELTTLYDNIDIKKRIFKENVLWVEIGIFSFCNRKCWFCPNSVIDRYNKNIPLEESLFLKLLSELREINYSNRIYLHRYNEPLADKELLTKRIKQVREYLPNSYILIITNGDYLTVEYLELLNTLGVNHIVMSYYYNYSDQNIPFDIENIVKPGMLKLINKLNLHYKVLYQNYKAYSVEIKYKNIYIEYKAIDFSKHATDRGGFLKDGIKIIDKTSQCFLPNFHVAV